MAATAFLDETTGTRVRLGSIYLSGIALASWNLNWKTLVFYVVGAVTAWTSIESTVGLHNARLWLVSWDAINRLLSATLVASTVYQVKTILDQRRRLINELRQALLELSRLKEMLPTCRLCRRLHWDADYEAKLNKLLDELSDPSSIGDVCPACLEARDKQIAAIPVEEYFADQETA